jgi:hypothetical protein
MQCEHCHAEIREGEQLVYGGQILCDDCYMMATNPAPKICDPLAVASALSTRKQMGQSGAEGLSEQQKKILQLIQQRGKITKQELTAELNLKPEVLEAEFAILRHCELARAFKEGSIIYLTKW